MSPNACPTSPRQCGTIRLLSTGSIQIDGNLPLKVGQPLEVIPMAEGRTLAEAVVALDDALGAAMVALQAHVDGHGPRGVELLPLLQLANDAADKRDALQVGR